MAKVPKTRSLHIFAISPEKHGGGGGGGGEGGGLKLNFCLQMNSKVFYKLIVSRWVSVASVARHDQSTQNNKFTISL